MYFLQACQGENPVSAGGWLWLCWTALVHTWQRRYSRAVSPSFALAGGDEFCVVYLLEAIGPAGTPGQSTWSRQQPVTDNLMAVAAAVLPWALRLHLSLFYLYGIYYEWPKRLTGELPAKPCHWVPGESLELP